VFTILGALHHHIGGQAASAERTGGLKANQDTHDCGRKICRSHNIPHGLEVLPTGISVKNTRKHPKNGYLKHTECPFAPFERP
jgi:hypothetical protein